MASPSLLSLVGNFSSLPPDDSFILLALVFYLIYHSCLENYVP